MDEFWRDIESASFWLGVLVGGVVGAILGVIADRLWARFEHRPKVKIRVGTYHGEAHSGFEVKITNVGRSPLPPCRPWLVSPTVGRYTMFGLEKKDGEPPPSEWHVGQTAVFRGPLVLNNKAIGLPLEIVKLAEKHQDFEFHLVMENSEVALYRNRRMGRAFVRAIEASLTKEKPAATAGGWGNTMDMTTVHGVRPRIKRVYDRIWWAWYTRYGQKRNGE